MQVKFVRKPTPHLLLDNIFSEEELKLVWTELNFIHPNLEPPQHTDGAKINGEVIKKNSGIFLYDVYKKYTYSHILKLIYQKIYHNQDLKNKWEVAWTKDFFSSSNWDSALVSYYEDLDNYKSHCDNSNFTTLMWIWREPKSFIGGDFTLDNYSHKIKVNNNSGIIFLSAEKHSVSTVKMTNQSSENCGRYCISSFCGLGLGS